MKITLDYNHSTRGHPSLWPAIPIALLASPAMAVVAAIFGCSLALDSWPLSPPNLSYSVKWGGVWGIAGGVLCAVLAIEFRRAAIWISVVGSVVVAALSGGSLFVYAGMLAAV